MQTTTQTRRQPGIILGKTDYERLSNLAATMAERVPDGSDALFAELERAVLVADGSVRPDVVKMGSTAAYETDAGGARTVTLVFPGDADISEGKISVLTPIGTALLGLAAGQSIAWTARDGRTHQLTVVGVEDERSPGRAARPVPHAEMASA